MANMGDYNNPMQDWVGQAIAAMTQGAYNPALLAAQQQKPKEQPPPDMGQLGQVIQMIMQKYGGQQAPQGTWNNRIPADIPQSAQPAQPPRFQQAPIQPAPPISWRPPELYQLPEWYPRPQEAVAGSDY